MVTIILKHDILIADKQGRDSPYKKIECNGYQKSAMVDGIEAVVDDKNIAIPIHNILAIIE